jgi:glycosyltransferase involved in cell wall biosynthesis
MKRGSERAWLALLMPSVAPEGFGRVILEAQCSGIPVVGSNRGAIPEVLGTGGVVVDDVEQPETYAAGLREVMGCRRPDYARQARQNCQRREFDPEAQVEAFVRFVRP